MSNHQVFRLGAVVLFGALFVAGAGCKSVASYVVDASVQDACKGKQPDSHTIPVNDQGGVSVNDTCVAIKWRRDSVTWKPETLGHPVSIVFLLSKDQPVPFEQMTCGAGDINGNRLCVLTACPEDCKTTFRADYQPFPKDDPRNYYYYSPAVGMAPAAAEKGGSDPGIRIDP